MSRNPTRSCRRDRVCVGRWFVACSSLLLVNDWGVPLGCVVLHGCHGFKSKPGEPGVHHTPVLSPVHDRARAFLSTSARGGLPPAREARWITNLQTHPAQQPRVSEALPRPIPCHVRSRMDAVFTRGHVKRDYTPRGWRSSAEVNEMDFKNYKGVLYVKQKNRKD